MKASRNEPCPCGSGRKYKHCCGGLAGGGAEAIAAVPGRALPQEAASALEAADALRSRGRVRESLPLYQRALALEPEGDGPLALAGEMIRRDEIPLPPVESAVSSPGIPE